MDTTFAKTNINGDMFLCSFQAVFTNGIVQLIKGDYLSSSSTSLSSSMSSISSSISSTSSTSTMTVFVFDEGETETITETSGAIRLEYIGATDTDGIVVINGVTFIVGDIGGQFVFDIGGWQEHTFTLVDEEWQFIAGSMHFIIRWISSGSQHFIIYLNEEFSSQSSGSSQSVISLSSLGHYKRVKRFYSQQS
jgi:hypothetical protein